MHDDPAQAALAIEPLLQRHAIALTGGIGTGKSTVAKMLAEQGYSVIDADQLARQVTALGSAGLARIVAHFGKQVLQADGTLDRRRLGALIFASPGERQALESITHPLIRAALIRQVQALGLHLQPRPFFYEAALVYETNSADRYAQVWVTFCSPERQLQRLVERDHIPEDRARAVIASQMSASEKAARADRLITTDGDLDDVRRQVAALVKDL